MQVLQLDKHQPSLQTAKLDHFQCQIKWKWRFPFWKQWKIELIWKENSSINKRNFKLPSLGIELETSLNQIERSSNWATSNSYLLCAKLTCLKTLFTSSFVTNSLVWGQLDNPMFNPEEVLVFNEPKNQEAVIVIVAVSLNEAIVVVVDDSGVHKGNFLFRGLKKFANSKV